MKRCTEIKSKYENQCLKCTYHFYDYFTLNNRTYRREICEKQNLTGLNIPCEDFKERTI